MIEWVLSNKEWLFSGAGITLITIVIVLVQKRFFKKSTLETSIKKSPALSINIEKSGIKHFSGNEYLAQINMTIAANNGPRTLRRLWLKAKSSQFFDENQGSLYTKTGMLIEHVVLLQESDLLEFSDSTRVDPVKKFKSDQFAIRDKVIKDGHTISLSVVDNLLPARMPDG